MSNPEDEVLSSVGPDRAETPVVAKNEPTPQLSDSLISEAVQKALTDPKIKEQLTSQAGGNYSKKEVESLIAADRERLAAAISGKSEKGRGPDPILETLVNDPENFVRIIKDMTLDEARREQAAQTARQQELEEAYTEVLASRKDVVAKNGARRLYASIYERTDASKSEKERFREALALYDAEMEELGVKAKIEEEVGISPNGAGMGTYSNTAKDLESEWKNYQKERSSAWEKAMDIT